jgi:hypothetical protein
MMVMRFMKEYFVSGNVKQACARQNQIDAYEIVIFGMIFCDLIHGHV